ncbi:alpha-tocopherol transfer protein-like isoform X1 [Ostrinia furnacalis]|uniref:alpha-tocopherol transfer protein-like isoform X1 n=2 Tax=Ostrinia furnacalis TaxID=93504 RepID=UPI00103F0528|nr:alpha-tocopherol transfer protein-like isoform X1 [Ostrinia furnacalis]
MSCVGNRKLIENMPVRPLPPDLAKKAKSELTEDPKRLQDGIDHLKDWIDKQPYLRARTDDQWLIAFLRGCKHSIERAKEKIDLYYSLRSTAPEFYLPKHTDQKFIELIKAGVVLILPKTVGPAGQRVTLVRASQYDPERFSLNEFLSVSLVIKQILYLEDDAFVVAGAINVVDLEGATLAHFVQMTPTQMKKMVVLEQDASPLRVKSAHYLCTPPGFETVFNMGKKILSEKHKNRIYIHKNKEELFDYVPKEIMPVEYGGNGGTVDEIIDYWIKKIQEYRSWLDEDLQYGTDEHLRPGSPKTAENMFGVEGSFRQLEFD